MTFDEYYEANKEAMTQCVTKEIMRRAFSAGFASADAMVPPIVDMMVTAALRNESVALRPTKDGFAARIGDVGIGGPSAIGCVRHVAAAILENNKPKIIKE